MKDRTSIIELMAKEMPRPTKKTQPSIRSGIFGPDIEVEQRGNRFSFKLRKSEIGSYDFAWNADEKSLKYSKVMLRDSYWTVDRKKAIFCVLLSATMNVMYEKLTIDAFPLLPAEFESLKAEEDATFPKILDWKHTSSPTQVTDIEVTVKSTKVTHFVQQAYLRNFSSNRGQWWPQKKDKARIYCYDKKGNCIFTHGNTPAENTKGVRIGVIAYLPYFYSVETEIFLAHSIERTGPAVIEKICADGNLRSIMLEDRVQLIRYILAQYLRTEASRSTGSEIGESGLKLLAQTWLQLNYPEDAESEVDVKINPDYMRRLHEQIIFEFVFTPNDVLNHLVRDLTWDLITIPHLRRCKGWHFYTSDNPVILHNQYYQRHRVKFQKEQMQKIAKSLEEKPDTEILRVSTGLDTGRGLMVEGIEIYFPLNPKYCLSLREVRNGLRPLSIGEINKEIVLQANMFVFSARKDFSLAKRVLTKAPETRDPSGKRTRAEILRKTG